MNAPLPIPGPYGYLPDLQLVHAGPANDIVQVADVRGWGYLTGGGGRALGLSNEEASARQDATGRLLAASWDLLAACEEALKHLEDPWSNCVSRAARIATLKAAIAKTRAPVVANAPAVAS